MNYSVIIAYVVGIILLFLMGRLLLIPMKIVLKLIYNALAGAIAIIVINYAGSLIGFQISLNIVTAFVVGILGIPGLILLIILKFIFRI